jgi:hypothetical protein
MRFVASLVLVFAFEVAFDVKPLAKQKKVTRPPGRDPACPSGETTY